MVETTESRHRAGPKTGTTVPPKRVCAYCGKPWPCPDASLRSASRDSEGRPETPDDPGICCGRSRGNAVHTDEAQPLFHPFRSASRDSEPHSCANHDETLDEAYRKGYRDGKAQTEYEQTASEAHRG